MSARFNKIFAGVVVLHVIVLSLVWVGFSAPLPRPPAAFIYEGVLAQDTAAQAEAGSNDKLADNLVLDHLKASYFNSWVKLRDTEKPFTN